MTTKPKATETAETEAPKTAAPAVSFSDLSPLEGQFISHRKLEANVPDPNIMALVKDIPAGESITIPSQGEEWRKLLRKELTKVTAVTGIQYNTLPGKVGDVEALQITHWVKKDGEEPEDGTETK